MNRTDNTAVKERLEAARQSLSRLDEMARPGASTSDAALVRATVAGALGDVVEAARLLSAGEGPPELERVPCPFCQNLIMSNATLCGFCWRRLPGKPAAAAHRPDAAEVEARRLQLQRLVNTVTARDATRAAAQTNPTILP